MKNIESKPLSSFIFIPLLSLIFLRPFFSGLAYPELEIWYEILIISLAILTFISEVSRRGGLNLPYGSKNIFFSESRTNPYNLSIFLLLSAYLISTVFSINIHNSINETIKFISYFSIFFMVSKINEGQKKILIKAIVIAAVIISIYSIYQYFWGYQHTLDYLKKINSDFLLNSSYAKDILIAKRAIGTFPSPNILGGYLIIIFFLALPILFERGTNGAESRTKYLILLDSARRILPLLIILSALLLTKSLGAWLSLIAALFILFLLSYKLSKASSAATTQDVAAELALLENRASDFEIPYNKLLKQRKLILIGSFVIIALALSFILLTRWERLINLDNPQNSITQRLNYWRTAIAIIKGHPFFGVGPGNFQEVFLKYKIGLSTNTRYAHNIFLHTWAETGPIGLIALIYLISAFFIKAKSKSRCIFLAGLAFLFHNLIDNTYFIPEAGFLWWVIYGLSESGANLRYHKIQRRPS